MICSRCGEEGATESMPFVGVEETTTIWFHNECQLRNVTGGLKHQRKLCACFIEGGDNDPPDGMTSHEEALEIARQVREGVWSFG